MNTRSSCLALALLFVFSLFYLRTESWACRKQELYELSELKQKLRDPQCDLQAIAMRYRQLGPPAVALLGGFRDQLNVDEPELVPAIERLMDGVAAQRHAAHSRLYWYTDLAAAQTAAANTGKPILSLRLLGKLDEEYSCANSRFFRTTLYANKEISDVLRDEFVLHWHTVRPAPKVTVDFGDGRTLRRTITGNSVHYVVTSDGVILEALPGLYAPQPFKAWLERSLKLHTKVNGVSSSSQRREILSAYHRRRRQSILNDWRNDIARVHQVPQQTPAIVAATARQATVDQLIAITDDTVWELIAATRAASEHALDTASVRLIRSENPVAAAAQNLSETKRVAEDPVFRLVRNLEHSIGIDSVRNEYLLHRQLHERFISNIDELSAGNPDHLAISLDELNNWVYEVLFRSPLDDPWLGLLPANAYNALDNGGVTVRPPLYSAARPSLESTSNTD